MHLGKANGGILKLPVDLVFMPELWASRTVLLKLDRNLLTRATNSQVNIPERTAPNTPSDPVFLRKGEKEKPPQVKKYVICICKMETAAEFSADRAAGMFKASSRCQRRVA